MGGRKLCILMLGSPGSGKSTQSRHVAQSSPGWRHVSIGELLRSEAKSGSERGKECERIMNSGGHIPTDIILDVLKCDVERHESNDKFLLDWSPSLEQILGFEKQISDYAAALWFDVSKDTLLSRMSDRANHSDRADDKAEIVEKRMETFQRVVLPCKHHLQGQGKLVVINGERSKKELFREVGGIVRAVERRHGRHNKLAAILDAILAFVKWNSKGRVTQVKS